MSLAITRRRCLVAGAVAAAGLLLLGGQSAVRPARATTSAPVPGSGQAFFGVHLDWGAETPSEFVSRTGIRPAQFGAFVGFPLTSADKTNLTQLATETAAVRARLFLTVEPQGGLATVTRSTARDFAHTLTQLNSLGVTVYVRFAHEMNGSWYPWGQQPSAYRSAFRLMATCVHNLAPGNAMVWSPNYGGGYPFTGGAYSAKPGTADFLALDTNHDGQLTMADDPYQPYWPGAAYVDWVGLTVYHWGAHWPWGANVVPEPGKLAASLTGTYNGTAGDETAVPDFYHAYAGPAGKPMVLSETAALYNEAQAGVGASESDIKTAWLGQVFDPSVATQFPNLKMVNWFEQRKYESETGSIVDWRATVDGTTSATLRAGLAQPRWVN